MGDADDEEVNVNSAELPVCAIHRQNDFIVGDEAQHEAGDHLLSEIDVGEALHTSGVTLELGESIECSGDLGEVHRANFEERDDATADELESAGINIKVGLQSVSHGFMIHAATFSLVG